MYHEHYRDEIFRAVWTRNVTVAVWRDAPRPEHMDILGELQHSQHARNPAGVGFINLVLSGRPSFSDRVREKASAITKQAEPFALGTAHVILMSGIAATAVRTFVSTILLISRSKMPIKVFGDGRSAAEWFAPLVSVGDQHWSAGDIAALIDALRT